MAKPNGSEGNVLRLDATAASGAGNDKVAVRVGAYFGGTKKMAPVWTSLRQGEPTRVEYDFGPKTAWGEFQRWVIEAKNAAGDPVSVDVDNLRLGKIGTGAGGVTGSDGGSDVGVHTGDYTDGTLVAGGSFFGAYRSIYKGSLFTEDLRGAPAADPGDPFKLGREIKRQASEGYHSIANTYGYNIATYLRSSKTDPLHRVSPRGNNRGYGFGTHNRRTGEWVHLPDYFTQVPMRGNEKGARGTDGSMAIIDVDTGRLWEMWQYDGTGPGGTYTWAGFTANIFGTTTGAHDVGSVIACGLQSTPLQIGIEEIEKGEICHVVGIELPKPSKGQSWPAVQNDGWYSGYAPVEGQRLILDPDYNVEKLPTEYLRILGRAGQKYGFIIVDKSGSVAVRNESPTEYMIRTGKPDPWKRLLEGRADWQALDGFPWDRLIALPKHYGRP